MKKLNAYKQAEKDCSVTKLEVDRLGKAITEIGRLDISSGLSISINSTDKQYIFAVGLLTSQIKSCKTLKLDSKDYKEQLDKVIELKGLTKDLAEWEDYHYELCNYRDKIFKLLSDDERFLLIKKPKKAK